MAFSALNPNPVRVLVREARGTHVVDVIALDSEIVRTAGTFVQERVNTILAKGEFRILDRPMIIPLSRSNFTAIAHVTAVEGDVGRQWQRASCIVAWIPVRSLECRYTITEAAVKESDVARSTQ